jgi:hypothetical protein
LDRVSLCSRGDGGVSARCGRASSDCKKMSLGFERVSSFLCRRVLEYEEELEYEASPEL